MSEVVLLLGGNVGYVRATQRTAEKMIQDRIGTILSRSREHWTEPWGFTDDRLFLNRALVVESDLDPNAILTGCLAIERELGRERGTESGFSARTIDIDILFIGDQLIDTEHLVVPHPRLHQRTFALAPAADIAPGLVHPVLHRSVLTLLNEVLAT